MPPILSVINSAYLFACLLTVSKSNVLANHSSQFKDSALIHSVKCCDVGARLIIADNSSSCSPVLEFTSNHLEIVAPVISNFSNDGKCDDHLDCVDVAQQDGIWKLFRLLGANCELREIPEYNYFPKCCPPDFAYDTRTHKCVLDDRVRGDDYLQVMKIGLSECPVHNYAVVDFEGHFDIDNAEKRLRMRSGKSFNYGEYCIDRNNDTGTNLVRACLESINVCRSDHTKDPNQGIKQCLWKCCPDGEIYVQKNRKIRKKCEPSINAEINLDALSPNIIKREDNTFAVISANLSQGLVQYKHRKEFHFKVNADGDIETMTDFVINYYKSTSMVYCIEQLQTNNSTTQFIYMFYFGNEKTSETFKSIILFLSALFAILTFLCYAILPEMQNLHGKCIMMECFFLVLGSAILSYTKVFSAVRTTLCTTLAYGTIFAFLGLFAWLNVICVDMWMTFGVLRGFKVKDRKSELKKFLFYSLYGFGVPILFVSFIIFAQRTNFLPDSMTPKIGNKMCFFDPESNIAYTIYFLVPMSVMLVINVVLFIKTILYCIKVKNEIQRMRQSSTNEKCRRKNTFKADKEKMIMLLKLFLIMGIPWLFEMISSFISFKWNWFAIAVENVVDTINCAKGIIIFCIFILKRSVLNLLSKKCGFKPVPRRSTELTSLTLTTNTH